MSEILKSAESITGPFSLVAFIVAAILLIYWRSVNTKRGLDFLYDLVDKKVTKDHFYDLARQVLRGAFWIVVLLLTLSFGSWVFARYLDSRPPPVEDADANAKAVAKNNAIATAPSDCEVRNFRDTPAYPWPEKPTVDEANLKQLLALPSEFRDWRTLSQQEFEQFDIACTTIYDGAHTADLAGAMGHAEAANLYTGPLGAHYGFEIHKGIRNSEVVIRNVSLVVSNYRSLPPTAAAGALVSDKPIVVVEIGNLGKDRPFPWRFPAKWLLNDPNRTEPYEFGRKRLSLDQNRWEEFFVKVAARDGGMYAYSIELEIQADNGPVTQMQLNKEPCVTTFFVIDAKGFEEYEARAGRPVTVTPATPDIAPTPPPP